MALGFYERLGVPQAATEEVVREGYRRALGTLVRQLRQATTAGADVSSLEADRDAVEEAFEVLSDRARRRVYDRFRSLDGEPLPDEADAFWELVGDALADPAAAAAVELVRSLTVLPIGKPLQPPVARAKPAPRVSLQLPNPVSMLSSAERAARVQSIVPAEPTWDPELPPGFGPDPDLRPTDPQSAGPAALDLEALAATYGYDGRYLAAVRQARNIGLDSVSEETRISQRYLEAIEANDFARLPASVFVKGYLREIAAVLDLDEEPIVEGYMALYARQRG
jgi:hypothetical protein